MAFYPNHISRYRVEGLKSPRPLFLTILLHVRNVLNAAILEEEGGLLVGTTGTILFSPTYQYRQWPLKISAYNSGDAFFVLCVCIKSTKVHTYT